MTSFATDTSPELLQSMDRIGLVHPTEAKDFYKSSIKQFNEHLLLGEDEAKRRVLIAMVLGTNAVLFGSPGGGKTTLGVDSYRIVDGIDPGSVVTIPPLAEITGQQLVGGSAEMVKQTEVDDQVRTEKTTTTIDPMLTANTQVIFANEINRASPIALNSILEAIESGTISNTEGTSRLDNLEYVISTMNPSEPQQMTFRIAQAMASRHAIGAIMGEGMSDEDTQIIMENNWEPSPDAMEATVSLKQLHALRASAKKFVLPTNVAKLGVQIVNRTVDGLKEYGIHESKPRVTIQMGKIVRAAALLDGQMVVEAEQFPEAVDSIVSARLGMLSARGATEAPELTKQILSAHNLG